MIRLLKPYAAIAIVMVGILLTAWALPNLIEASPSGQTPEPDPLAINITDPNCDYAKFLAPNQPTPFVPSEDEFIEQETDVRFRCTFSVSNITNGKLRIESGLESWKILPDESTFKRSDVSSTQIDMSIASPEFDLGNGGHVTIVLKGKTPRGVSNKPDEWGYKRDYHKEQAFLLQDLNVVAPGQIKAVLPRLDIKAASPVYIDAVEELADCGDAAACDEARRLLYEEGLPEQSMRVAKLGGGGFLSLLPWIIVIILVVAILVVAAGVKVGILQYVGPGNPGTKTKADTPTTDDKPDSRTSESVQTKRVRRRRRNRETSPEETTPEPEDQ